MMNKRGWLFALYIVIFTLFICGLSITLYFIQQDRVSHSLISPTKLLELQDKQEIFELREESLLTEVAKETKTNENWCNSAETKKKFIEKLVSIEGEKLREFLFLNLYIEGLSVQQIEQVKTDVVKQKEFLENVYSIKCNSNNIEIDRRKIEKKFRMYPEDLANDNSFSVDIEYFHEKTFLIPKSEVV